jgi:KDO2-lipid IV(A) lauroyltransferase
MSALDAGAYPALAQLQPSWVGVALYNLLPIRRRVILSNMRQVFGERLSDEDLRRLAQCFYSHALKSVGEYLSMILMPARRITARVEVQGVEHMLQASEKGKGILLLAGHFGNWELSAIGACLQFQQYRNRFHVIRKPQIGFLETIAFRRFEKAGLRVVSRQNALSRITDALADNEVAVFIMDQHASPGPKAVPVEFFGRKASTNRSLALLAAHSGAPVIPARSYRRPDGRHVLHFEAPLTWITADDTREEIYLNTRRYNQVLERFVLEQPDQWFWMHRRWKEKLFKPRQRPRKPAS